MDLKYKYNGHRKKREYHDDHPLTRKQRRKEARLRRERRANLQETSFGKINWDAYEHRQLWDMIKSAEPGSMGERAHQWAELASNVDAATGEVRKTLQELLMSWRGKSAIQAADSTSRLTTWASGAGQTARHIGDGLDTYTAAVVEAKKKIPEPVHPYLERWFREGYDISALHGPNGAYLMNELLDDHLPSKNEAVRAKQEAVRVMDEYESASKGVHSTLPRFTTAPTATGGDPDGGGAGEPGDPDGSGNGHDPGGIDDSTMASSVLEPAFSPGGESFSGSGGVGAGAGAFGAGGPGAAGMASGAGGTAGAGGGLAAGAGAGAAGARGGAGGFGMYPPMAGAGNRDQDKEHTNRYDLGLDLMDDLPPAYPPVFGQ
jgi:hypothetical protein